MTPIFESHTLASMERAKQTFVGRGTEYGDTWRECRFLKMKAVAKELKLAIPENWGHNILPPAIVLLCG